MDSFNLFKRYALVAAVFFPVILGGCAYFSPSAKQNRAEIKVEKTKEAIFTSEEEILKEGKAFVYAIDYSLKLSPDTNKYTEIAREMSSRAVETLSPIEKADIIKMRAIVDGLASTNKQILARAQSMLEEKDSEIVVLQNQISDYKEILKKNEAKFVEVSRESASLAQTWWTIKRILWWGVYIFIAFIICKFLVVLVPPPYNSIFGIFEYIIGGFIGMIFKLLPKAKETAKVVSSDVQVALNHVVESIEETKTKVNSRNALTGAKSMGLEQLKNELNTITDSSSKSVIIDTKKTLGYL